MTTEQLLKLDEIRSPRDLVWRNESPNAGEPECLCSACGELVKDDESFEDDPEHQYGGSEAERNNFPIRCWEGEGETMMEAVLHTECFQWLHAKGVLKAL